MSKTIESASLSVKDLFKVALLGRERAHAPYSGYKVGAAIKTASGMIFSGCNVENASYGGSCCAERTAIFKAVSEGETRITEIMVVTDSTPPWPPCGFCRQVMAEFGSAITVYCANVQGQYEQTDLATLLPSAFTGERLKKV